MFLDFKSVGKVDHLHPTVYRGARKRVIRFQNSNLSKRLGICMRYYILIFCEIKMI